MESWARLDDLTVRAARALNIGVYGPSEGVRPTSPLLSRLLESNSPVVEHVRTDKTFSDQSPHIRPRVASSILIILPRARDPALAADGQSTAMYLCYMPPMNPAYVEAEPRPLLPRPRASQATTNFCRVFLRVRTYQISLPPSLPVGSMYVLLDRISHKRLLFLVFCSYRWHCDDGLPFCAALCIPRSHIGEQLRNDMVLCYCSLYGRILFPHDT